MKIREDFILRKIADTNVVVPVGKAVVDFSGMINLNDSGAFLFRILQQGATEQELVKALTDEYDVPTNIAQRDVALFVAKVKDAGILE